MNSRKLKSLTTALVSRRELVRAGALIIPAAVGAPWLFSRTARAQTTATFDYYISPSGSDGNAGTQASPWAITAINTKRATYAGRRVGLMDGTYSIRTLIQAGNGDGYTCALSLNGAGGSSGSPTVIQAVNRGAAIIDCGSPTQNNPALGTSDGSTGYITIDGLKIINGGSKSIHLGLYTGTNLNIPGWIVQNCEITGQNCHNVGGGATAGNYSCIEIQGGIGAQIRNNYFHGNVGNAGPTNGDHFTSTIQWTSANTLYEYNTCLGPGIYGKETHNFGTTLRYNYVDNTGWTGVQGIQDFVNDTSTATGTTTTIHHNVLKTLMNDMRPTLSQTNYLADRFLCYNNTFIGLAGGVGGGVLIKTNTGLATYYNNVHYNAASGDVDLMCVDIDGPGVWDYDLYFATGSYVYGTFPSKTSGVRNGSSTLAAWKGLMSVPCEAHALDHQDPQFVRTGSGANFYQLQSSSPAKNAGRTNGTTNGSACDMGAWGNGAPSVIGSSLVTGGASPPTVVPEAPSLTVS